MAPSPDAPRMPRWVKIFGIVAVIVLVLVVAIALFGGDKHGPGRHHVGVDPGAGNAANFPAHG